MGGVGAGVRPGYAEAHQVSFAVISYILLNLKVFMQVLCSEGRAHGKQKKSLRKVYDEDGQVVTLL